VAGQLDRPGVLPLGRVEAAVRAVDLRASIGGERAQRREHRVGGHPVEEGAGPGRIAGVGRGERGDPEAAVGSGPERVGGELEVDRLGELAAREPGERERAEVQPAGALLGCPLQAFAGPALGRRGVATHVGRAGRGCQDARSPGMCGQRGVVGQLLGPAPDLREVAPFGGLAERYDDRHGDVEVAAGPGQTPRGP
jgi:hypothetical protein